MPDVSVVIPTFNRLQHLEAAVGSCFDGNDDLNVQVVIVDDGSTDGTREWLEELADPRLIIMSGDHHGAARARNIGLARANSDYIKFLDDDDLLNPGALKTQFGQIGRLAREEIPYGRVGWIGERGARIGEASHRVRGASEDALLHVMYNNIMTASPLHRKEALLKVGGFDETLDCHQEYELHLRLTANGYRFKFFDHLVYLQRHHASSNRISNNDRLVRDPLYGIKLLDRRLEMLTKAGDGHPNRDWVIGLARMYWNYGREMIRRGDHIAAKRYFARARELAGAKSIADPWYYRLTARLFGPWLAERMSECWVRMSGRTPIAALDQIDSGPTAS